MGLLGAIGTGVGYYFGNSAGAAAGGAIGTGIDSFLGGQQANSASADAAQRQMEFQAEMSNTSWQRAVADMKAAGLSPMLAYTQGGASSPTGASYQAQNAQLQGAQGAAAFAQSAGQVAQIENIKADTELKHAQAGAADATAAQAAWNAHNQGVRAEQDVKESTARIETGNWGGHQANVASAGASDAQAQLTLNNATKVAKEIEAGGPEAAVNLLKQQFRESLARTGNLNAATDQVRATISKLESENLGIMFDNSRKEAFSEFYRSELGKNSPTAEFLMSMGKDVSDMLLSWKKFGSSKRPRWSETTRSDNSGNVSTTTTQSGIE